MGADKDAGIPCMNSDVIKRFKNIVGDPYVIHHPDDLVVFEYDDSIYRSIPRAGILPKTTEQVSEVISFAVSQGIHVSGRGEGPV